MESLLCTIAETAALLRVSVDTVRRSIRAGVIPCKRLRTNIRISRQWIDNYVAETAPILLTRRQVAVKLGVSKYVVDGLRRRGLLPTVKVGGLTMVPAAAVSEYVKRNRFAFLRASGMRKSSAPRPASSTNLVEHPVRTTMFSNVRGV
jgi:excisionase family DNA binding protein